MKLKEKITQIIEYAADIKMLMRGYIVFMELYIILLVNSCYSSLRLGTRFPGIFTIIAGVAGTVVAVMCWIYLYKEERKSKNSEQKDKRIKFKDRIIGIFKRKVNVKKVMRGYLIFAELYTLSIAMSCCRSLCLGIKFPEIFAIEVAAVTGVIVVICRIYLYKEKKKSKNNELKGEV